MGLRHFKTEASGEERNQKVETMSEEHSFEAWYDEYFDKVNRYLRYRVKNEWDADDLTTTVFLKAFEKRNQVKKAGSFGAWIFRIAHNTFLDYVRKKKEMPVGDENFLLFTEEDNRTQPETETLSRERMQELHRLLHSLPPDQRDVLILRYFGELKIAEVAEVLGRTESSVKMLSYRGILQLRKRWKEGELSDE